MAKIALRDIPRGNTCPGVNELILEHILRSSKNAAGLRLLDIPCGKGEFLDTVAKVAPNFKTYGVDISVPSGKTVHEIISADLSRPGMLDLSGQFDIVTCISGVMEFDNTLSFFEGIRDLLTHDGEFIVSNDNILSVPDRISYFLFGRFRQYRLRWEPGEPTWKVVTINNLHRILADAGFDVIEVRYVTPKAAEWLWFPIAAIIFAMQRLIERNKATLQMVPFISLFSRHYVLFCQPRTD